MAKQNDRIEDKKTNSLKLAKCMIKMLADLGFELTEGMKILDFGCGKGYLASAFAELGYDVYGVDIRESELIDKDHFAKMELDNYVFPFEDNYFDFIYSTSVLEHTQNTQECLEEIYRVLKPGGVTYHTLPSMYRLLESHIKVPFGGVIHSDMWLRLWAILGVRSSSQKGKDWKVVFETNKNYCINGLNYNRFGKLKKMIENIFGNIKIVGKEYIDNMPGGAARLGRKFHFKGMAKLIFVFREWHIYMSKQK